MDPTSPRAQAAISDIEQSNPDLRSALGESAIRLAQSGTALLAINPAVGPDGFASDINVIAKPDPTLSASDLLQLQATLPSEYAKLGGRSTGSSYVTLDGKQALRATDTLPLKTSLGKTISVSQTQYFLGANGFIYVITFSGNDHNMAAIASSFSTN